MISAKVFLKPSYPSGSNVHRGKEVTDLVNCNKAWSVARKIKAIYTYTEMQKSYDVMQG